MKTMKIPRETIILGYENGCPIVAAYPREDVKGGLEFWCDYCRHIHYHGIGEGHRAAHCNSNSPFKATGYILREYSTHPIEDARRFR